jgi:uncharacterized membrane protein YkgB
VEDSDCRCDSSQIEPDTDRAETQEENMLLMVLTVILILVFIGALPAWPHSRNWGYYPSGGIGLVLMILLILLLLGWI